MTASVASQQGRSRRHVRSWAMACAALVLGASVAATHAAAQVQGQAQVQRAASVSAEPAAPALDKAQIDALLATPDKVLFLDVRRADEVSTIGGFPAYLSIQAADLERYLPFIPRDRKIVTVSNHANRARRAAALLASHGFQVAGAAGVQDYAAQGGTLTGQKPAASSATAAPAN